MEVKTGYTHPLNSLEGNPFTFLTICKTKVVLKVSHDWDNFFFLIKSFVFVRWFKILVFVCVLKALFFPLLILEQKYIRCFTINAAFAT